MWHIYVNGNYNVRINDATGTKIRRNDLDYFAPEFPESFDLKITNQCDMGCAMCHEDSTPDGKHGDIMSLPFLGSIHPFTEVAIGGGNPLSHPDLVRFLKLLKKKNIFANMTVNKVHFMSNLPLLHSLVEQRLIYGLGVSYTSGGVQDFISEVSKFDNAVVHIINGMITPEQYYELSGHNLTILILGYKDVRRGIQNRAQHGETIAKNQAALIDAVRSSIKSKLFKAISFDNLALKQLGVKNMMTGEEWSEFYMGDDGQDGQFTSASMFIDAVEGEFARNSCCRERYKVTDNITEMFQFLVNEGRGM